MDLVKIALAGIVGTSLMTLFSYSCQLVFNIRLGEPKLLSQFLQNSRMAVGKDSRTTFWGWVLHYITGIILSVLIALFIYLFESPLSWGMGVVMGFTFGLLGVLGWQTMYYLHRNPPTVDRRAFYLQLVVAHIFFGIGAMGVYKFWPL